MTHLVNTDWNLIVALPWLHNIVIPPAPPVPGPSLDIPCTQKWLGAFITGKFTTTVMHRGEYICLDSHNVGMMVPHITYPPSFMLAIIIPFSKRKMSFSASKVEMNKKPVACAQLIPIPTPMLDCGDPIGNPLTPFPMNFFNTVEVGMTLGDLLWGLVGIAIDLLIDALFFKLGGGSFKSVFGTLLGGGKNAVDKLAQAALKKAIKKAVEKGTEYTFEEGFKRILKEAIGKIVPTNMSSFKKWALKQVAGSVKDSAKDGKPELKAKVGHPNFGEVGVQLGNGSKVTAGGFGGSYDSSAPASAPASSGSTGNTPKVEGGSQPQNLTP